MGNRVRWEDYAILLALAASSRSEDPFVKVGAVVLRADRSVAGVGYNGAPPGVDIDWSDREGRRPFVIHAETNALRYVTSDAARGGLLAVTHTPCPACLVNVSAYGIKDVVFHSTLDNYPLKETARVATATGIRLRQEIDGDYINLHYVD